MTILAQLLREVHGVVAMTRSILNYSSRYVSLIAFSVGCSTYSATINKVELQDGGLDGGMETGGASAAGSSSAGASTAASSSAPGGASAAGATGVGGVAGTAGTTGVGGVATQGGASDGTSVSGSSSIGGTTQTVSNTGAGGVVGTGGLGAPGGTSSAGGLSANGGVSVAGGAGATSAPGPTGGAVAGGGSGAGGIPANGGVSTTGGSAASGGAGTGGSSCITTVTGATFVSPFESTWQTCPGSGTTLVGRVLKRPAASLHVTRGDLHTCIATAGGKVRCWGAASYGQLGYGNTNTIGDDELPRTAGDVNISATASVVQVAAGSGFTCAVLDSGAVRCWGYSGDGALGYGPSNTNNIGDNEVPADAGDVPVGGLVVEVSCGASQTCALLDTGAVRCWGSNNYGQLGYPGVANVGISNTPQSVADINGEVSFGGKALQIAAGAAHTCALLENGAVRCWGWNNHGQLGYGNTANVGDDETPASVGDINLGGTAMQVAAGGYHTCALLEGGNLRCWGDNSVGQLGYGNTADYSTTLPSVAGNVLLGGTAVQVSTGQYSTCALLDSGAIRCWGRGLSGELGYGNTNNVGDNELPQDAGDVPVGGLVAQVVAGRGSTNGLESSCAFLKSGSLRCWGANGLGQLGYGNTTDVGNTATSTPAAIGNVQFQ